jgi:hypothetical protein
MPHSDPRSPVTLEQLIQLKRAERPDADFWARFDAELRQKQLAALVQRRAWWQELPQLLARRAYLPIGAAAVLTFTLVSVRNYTPEPLNSYESDWRAATRTAAPATLHTEYPAAMATSSEADFAERAMIDDRTAIAAVQLSEQLPPQAGDLVPWSARSAEETPSARSIAANLARLEETDPELARSLWAARLHDPGFSLQEAAVHAVQVAAVGGVASRRNRLMAQLSDRQFTPDPEAPEVLRERMSRRLGDTELAGGWNRVGVKADRVSLKF